MKFKKLIHTIAYIAVLIAFNSIPGLCQVDCNNPSNTCSRNGYQLPVRGNVRILLVFAEMPDGCPGNPASYWPAGQMPSNKDQWLDHVASATPTTGVSKYYKDVSLGEYNVIGDYYNGVVQVPCGSSVNAVINKLNIDWQPNGSGQYVTAHGYSLSDFDNYSLPQPGKIKPANTPDGLIDAVVIIWRNHPTLSCFQGYGVGNSMGNVALKNKAVQIYGSWGGCIDFFKLEYFHAMFGSNNFHIGGGAGMGTFSWPTAAFSTCAQSYSASDIICGWDRLFMDYKGNRSYALSALNTSGIETPSDLTIATHPNESTFILRDFVTVGDAIRIKLPHINWAQDGDVKNQYLWIENHQKVSEFDNNKNPCSPWSKGLYAYLQVGKDVLNGPDTYGGCYYKPNQLNDHLFPLSAEGSYDFYYDYANQGTSSEYCIWDNNGFTHYGILYPDGTSKPNPFTGFSDLYGIFDADQNGIIDKDDYWKPLGRPIGAKKYTGAPGSSLMLRSGWGDILDAFKTNGQKIYLGSNPAPVPVYTRKEGAVQLESSENRTIYLNNLSIEILSTDYYANGTGAYQVKIKWDDNVINHDTRWCGHLKLKNDVTDPLARASKITIASNKTITVDQGYSPTRREGTLQSDGSYLFTDPSALFLEAGTITTLQSNAKLKVLNGSSLVLRNGATLNLYPSSQVVVDTKSTFCIENLSDIHYKDPSASITINGITYTGSLPTATATNTLFNNQIVPSGPTYRTSITVSGTSTMTNPGSTLLAATNYIQWSPNTTFTPSGGTLLATINPVTYVSQCYTVKNYSNLTLPFTGVCGTLTSGNDLTLGEGHQHAYLPSHNHDVISVADKSIEFNIYPNPSSGIVNIRSTTYSEKVNVSIFNSIGENIFNTEYTGDSCELNLSDLRSGIYYLRITSDNYSEHNKLIVNK